MNIGEYVLNRAGQASVREHASGIRLSGPELRAAAHRIAALPAVQERKQMPTLVEVDLTVRSLVGMLGVLLSGGIAVPLPGKVLEHRLARALDVTGADAVLIDPSRPSPLQRLLSGSGNLHVIPHPELTGPAAAAPDEPLEAHEAVGQDEDPAVILLTSGTTGIPKGVTLTHRNVIANLEGIQQVLPLTGTDAIALTLPLQYSFGLSTTLLTLALGASGVFLPPLQFPDEFVTAMLESGPSVFAGVPGHYQALLGQQRFTGALLPGLRAALQAGGPMPEALIHRFTAAFPDCALFRMYGQTEATARLTTLPAELTLSKPRSVGPALPGVTLEIRDLEGRLLPTGAEGEVYARGPNVMVGYWNDATGTAAALTEHGLRTGDMGRLDEAGHLEITGRRSEFAKIRGERLAAREIEDVICTVPGIVDAVVQVGQPPTDVDDRLRALLIVDDPDTPAVLLAVKRAVISAFGAAAVPQLRAVDALPLTESGKKIRHYSPESEDASPSSSTAR